MRSSLTADQLLRLTDARHNEPLTSEDFPVISVLFP